MFANLQRFAVSKNLAREMVKKV